MSRHEDTGAETERHIVDQLIRERAPGLSASPVWPLVKPPLYALLNYQGAREMADDIADMDAYEALDHASDLLELDLSVEAVGCVPRQGACLVVVNHPTGIADGIALYDALKGRRPDVAFFANEDAERICPGLGEAVVPVVWPPEERTMETSKETLRQALEMIGDERAIVIFPAGAIARMREGELREEPWEATFVSLAGKHGVDIVPAHLSGPYSRLFNIFDRFSEELRDVTLFHEFLNKKGERFELEFGAPIDAGEIGQGDEDAVSERLRCFVQDDLPGHPGKAFAP
ncbi:acyltransferase [Marinicauda algicola]|uniref:Acyltransferase n=2 Tax=Marinicauda algicola TaxID=2029849 RepID=A0A4S2H314_9PROT|nr:acyltransferase [Marinicauda algicola]